MKRVNSIVYGLFGAGAIVYGVATLLSPSVLVSEAAQSFHLMHILREQGAAAIFIGLMAFWCIFNYERRWGVHYFLMVLTLLLAAIHWWDYFAGHLFWMSPLYNSVPFAVLLAMVALDRPSRQETTG
jgi:hypothetical protein